MPKLAFLLALHVLSFFHKLWHNFIRECVVALCSLILLALFYYVFNDFLNQEVRKISPKMRDDFAMVLAWILIFAGAFSGGRLIRAFFVSPRSLFKTIQLFGEEPAVRKTLALFHICLVLSVIYGPIWYVVNTMLVTWSLGKSLLYGFMMVLVSLSASLLGDRKSTQGKGWHPSINIGSRQAMVRWRLRILFSRNRVAQFCFGLFLLCALLMACTAYLALPFIAAFAIAFWGGFLGSCALCFQFGEDLQAGWLEKSSGVSHRHYMDTLFIVAGLVGSLLGILHATLWWLGALPYKPMVLPQIAGTLRIFLITATPCWIVPAVLFQIDARRVLIPILTSFLVGLFVATAIYASWFAVALLGLIAYYGYTSQEGLFYRA